MLLDEIRKRIDAAVRRMGKSYSAEEKDYALQAALHDIDLSAFWALSYTSSVTMTAHEPEVTVSSLTGLRPERVVRAQIALTNQSTWATSTAYAVNDVVKGDGSPDAYLWVCTAAHTSGAANEPGTDGGGSFWERRLWKRGDRIDIVDFASIAHLLGDRPVFRLYLPDDYVFDTSPAGDNAGKPRVGAFMTEAIFVTYPPPDIAYKIEFLMRTSVTDWEPGFEGNLDIAVPDNVLLGVINLGTPYYLDGSKKDAMQRLRMWESFKDRVDGYLGVDVGDGHKDERSFPDWRDSDPYTGRLLYHE